MGLSLGSIKEPVMAAHVIIDTPNSRWLSATVNALESASWRACYVTIQRHVTDELNRGHRASGFQVCQSRRPTVGLRALVSCDFIRFILRRATVVQTVQSRSAYRCTDYVSAADDWLSSRETLQLSVNQLRVESPFGRGTPLHVVIRPHRLATEVHSSESVEYIRAGGKIQGGRAEIGLCWSFV